MDKTAHLSGDFGHDSVNYCVSLTEGRLIKNE